MTDQVEYETQDAGNGNPPPKQKPLSQPVPVEPVQDVPAETTTQPVQN